MVSDEIPQARRTAVALRQPRDRWSRRLSATALLLLALTVALVVVFPGLFNRSGAPSSLGRLGLRPAADGRLLGHFPYGEVDQGQLVAIAPGLQLQREAASALVAMQQAARADGIELVVLSAYRSVATQNRLFFEVKSERNQTARERARVSAPPGYSEHSTGYAVDLGDGAAPGTNLAAAFEQTAAFAWLQANAARYQFTLSFPEGNAQGVNYEPWHWRFEGTAQALRVFEPAQRISR
ncbi:MAG: D-alanyl-D-alanine carboxypeptidase family protein [Cyanobacteria bacterium M_surface_9_m1_291]|nr:D-alanyl-D-alanine carboxypeptidase family protein [Cyanobacteria bacterium M_surface_9_m1_291]